MSDKPQSSADLLRMLQGLRSLVSETPPPGFYTRQQLERDWKCSHSHVKNLIAAGLKAGRLARIDLRVTCDDGRIRRTPHYGPADAYPSTKAKP